MKIIDRNKRIFVRHWFRWYALEGFNEIVKIDTKRVRR